jgi:hypothetical protein
MLIFRKNKHMLLKLVVTNWWGKEREEEEEGESDSIKPKQYF